MLKGTELDVAHKISLASRNIQMAQTAIDSASQFMEELLNGLAQTANGDGPETTTAVTKAGDEARRAYANGYQAGLRKRKAEGEPVPSQVTLEASAKIPSGKLQAIEPRKSYGNKGRLYPWLIRSYIQTHGRLTPEQVVQFAAEHGYLAELATAQSAIRRAVDTKELKPLGNGIYGAGPKLKKISG